MGTLLGIPEWLATALFVLAFLAILLGVGFVALRRARRRLAAKRASPSRQVYLTLMGPDVDPSTSAWLWDMLQVYYRPLTPHPDDLLIGDAHIDHDDIDMDWPRDFERHQGIGTISWPSWPDGWPLTVRNYGRWLDMGLAAHRMKVTTP